MTGLVTGSGGRALIILSLACHWILTSPDTSPDNAVTAVTQVAWSARRCFSARCRWSFEPLSEHRNDLRLPSSVTVTSHGGLQAVTAPVAQDEMYPARTALSRAFRTPGQGIQRDGHAHYQVDDHWRANNVALSRTSGG